MSDDFGTVNVRRGERAREIEVLRQHYRRHRESLTRLVSDAPTEHLAGEYLRLIQEIDSALVKLDELEGVTGAVPPPVPPVPHERLETEPGMRPLVTTPQHDPESTGAYDSTSIGGPEMESDSRSRLVFIALAAIVALALIGWLIWRASRDRGPEGAVVEETATTATTATTTAAEEPPVTPAPPPAAAILSVSPASADYGTIRRGTRATRQFEVRNNSDEPVTIEVARSACRCLYYEHAPVVPPKGRESITVTVDGAKAKSGPLRESLNVRVKANPSVGTTFDVIATVQ